MNWNRTLRRGGGRKTAGNDNSTSYKKALAAALLLMGWGASCNFIYADVTVSDSKYNNMVTKTDIGGNGTRYDINNQWTNKGNALNRFDKFDIGQPDIANLHMGDANRQINVVQNKINIDGVVNALKNGKIGGDVYFLSSKGIAVGATGVINVGRLSLGTNTTQGYLEALTGNTGTMSAGQLAGNVFTDGNITVAGKINAIGDITIGAAGKADIQSSAVLQTGAVFDALPSNMNQLTADQMRAQIVNLSGIEQASAAVSDASGNITIYSPSAGAFSGKAATRGGDFTLAAGNGDQLSDVTIPKEVSISITDAYVDTDSLKDGAESGDITVSARNVPVTKVSVMPDNTASVSVKGSTLHAGDESGSLAGNVDISAESQVDLKAWNFGGATASVTMDKSSDVRNTITGDNVSVSAVSTASSSIGSLYGQISESFPGDVEVPESVWTTAFGTTPLAGVAQEIDTLRGIASVAKISSQAEVNLSGTDLIAQGGKKIPAGTAEDKIPDLPHGTIAITSHAVSEISSDTETAGDVGFSYGQSDLSSHVNIKDSTTYSQSDTKVNAKGENLVEVAVEQAGERANQKKDLMSAINVSVALANSDVGLSVDKDSTMTSGGNVDMDAEAIRTLSSSASALSGQELLGIGLSFAKSDTAAEAAVAGTVYAAGDVSVDAVNRISKEREKDGTEKDKGDWTADSSSAASLSEVRKQRPARNPPHGQNNSNIFKSILGAFTGTGGRGGQTASSFNNKWGLNSATAVLLTDNTSKASLTGKVRGAEAGVDGLYKGSDSLGAGSLAVTAQNTAKTSITAGVYQDFVFGKKGGTSTNATRKENGVALALNVALLDENAEAYVGGDVKTKGDVKIEAETIRPQNEEFNPFEGETAQKTAMATVNTIFDMLNGEGNDYLSSLVDSWSQASGVGDKMNGAGSISVMDYGDTAKAYAAEGAKIDAGGNAEIHAENDVTTINFSGQIRDPVKGSSQGYTEPAFWKKFTTHFQNPLQEGTSVIGGAAQAVILSNAAEAYVAQGASVKSGKDTNVTAENRAWNLNMAAAGGNGQDLAIDGTVNVNQISNSAKAYIAGIAEGQNVNVTARDNSSNINIGGAVALSGGTSVGATIAYNDVVRDTEAYVSGKVTAEGGAEIAAENKGDIIAISAAGSVTYDKKNTNALNSGSNGANPTNPTAGQSSGMQGLAQQLLNMGGTNRTIQTGSSIASSVGGQNAQMQQAKDGFALAAGVGVNFIEDSARAYAAGTAETPVSITADYLTIDAKNNSRMNVGSGTLALDLKQQNNGGGTAIAGSFLYNDITAVTEAYGKDAELTLSGREKDEKGQETDESLSIRADNTDEILNIAASGSGTRNGKAAIAGQVSLNGLNNTTKAYAENTTVHADEKATVSAIDAAKIGSYTGAASFAMGDNAKAAVGASVGVNLIENTTEAYGKELSLAGTSGGQGGDADIRAEEKVDLISIVASGAVNTGNSSGLTGSGSASGSKITTKTSAYLDTAQNVSAGDVSVRALNQSGVTQGVGSLSLATGQSNSVGAAVAVMVGDHTVGAYVKGDGKKENTITADSLKVSADNLYNNSAKKPAGEETNDDPSNKTVAVGGAVSQGKVGAEGSVTVNVLKQTTDAYLGSGSYHVAGDTSVTAETKAKLFGLAGSVAASKGTGIGAAVDTQVYDGHTYAGIQDGAHLAMKGGALTVEADSAEDLLSIGATLAGGTQVAGAGAAGAHSIETDTKAYIGNTEDKDIQDGRGVVITGAGQADVHAKDATTLDTWAGAGAGSNGQAGVGLTAAVEVVNKTVQAYVGNHASLTGTGLSVKAENTSSSTTAAIGLGVATGQAGFAGAASETFVDHTTKAFVGKNASVTISGADNRGTEIEAVSSFKQGSGAGSAGIGAGQVGVGLGNATVSLHADTEAYAGDGAKIIGGEKVAITASHTTDVTYATVALGVGGTAGFSGAVGVNVYDTKTYAYAGDGAELSAEGEEGIAIEASDTTAIDGGNGGAAAGLKGGAGAVVSVMNITKDTEAYAGTQAKLDSKGKVSLKADASENLTNVSIQAAGGLYAGLAGAVNVTNIDAVTKAFTDTGAQINQKEGYQDGGDITVHAGHEIEKLLSSATGGAFGAGAIGAAVDVANIRTQTNAYLGDSNTVHTKGALKVEAGDNLHGIESYAVAAAVGGVGLSGSISVYNFGGQLSDKDAALLSGKVSEEDGNTTIDKWAASEANKSEVKGALTESFETYGIDQGRDILEKLDTEYSADAPAGTAGEKGTLARIGKGTTVDADSVSVKADDTLSMKTGMGNLSEGGVGAAGATVSVVNTDTQTKALVDDGAKVTTAGALDVAARAVHTMENTMVGASVSTGISVQGTVQTWNDTSNVYALIGDTQGITAGSVSVAADNDRKLTSTVTGASVGMAAVNGAVVNASIGGTSEAGIGSEDGEGTYTGEVKADGDISITSSADTDLSAKAIGAAAGLFSGTGTGVTLSSDVDTKSFVGKGEKLSAAKDMTITARNTPKLNAQAVSAGAGLAGVGVTVASVTSRDDASVSISDGAGLAAGEAARIQAETARPEEGYNAFAQTKAGAGGVIGAGAVSDTTVTMTNKTNASIGNHVTISAGTLQVTASHNDRADLQSDAVAAGGYSGSGADTDLTVDSAVNVSIGDGTSVTTTKETSILADNVSTKDYGKDNKNVLSAGAAVISGNGIVNNTSFTHTTGVAVGDVSFQAAASGLTDEEKKAGKTIHDKNAISIDAHSRITSYDNLNLSTGTTVGAAHIVNNTKANVTTTVNVASGADFKAGDTKEANTFYEKEEYAAGASHTGKTASYSGGSIGIGTRNDADLLSETVVDVFGAAGYAGSENNVTYTGTAKTTFDGKAETALGDIRTAAGRDSSGAAGSITARANGDILNATAIPISVNKDPTAKITSDADLQIGKDASIRSDRDIYLQSTGGNTYASGYGEVKDWVNAVGEAFGAEGSKVGKSQVLGDANAKIEGTAETGIHRNLSITIWGEPEKDSDGHLTGKWITYVKRNGQISYTIGETVPVGADLFQRLDELQNLKGDPAAMAAYEMERNFIEAKLVEQGLGYYTQGGQFVRMPSDDMSELQSVKDSLKQYEGDLAKYETAQEEAAAQQGALETLGNAYKDWKDASNALAGAETAYNTASTAKDNAESALTAASNAKDTAYSSVKAAAEAAGIDVDAYMAANASEQIVVAYNAAVTDYNEANTAFSEATAAFAAANSAYEKAGAAVDTAKTGYQNKAQSYNTAYKTSYTEDPSKLDTTVIKNEWDALVSEQSIYGSAVEGITYQKNQVAATDAFVQNGGTEQNGHFYLNGQEVTKYTYDGEEYSLLHTVAYQRLTHNLYIGDITAQLGDIHLEADTVSGAGTLKAGGDASVTITNSSPHNLIVGNVNVVGKGGTTAAGLGGMIFYNNSALQGSAGDVKASISSINKDKTASFTGGVETRNTTDKPQVTIESTFRPTENKDYMVGGEPVFAAPTLRTTGIVYNPRGGLTVTSASGDVYNDGTFYTGTVDVAAANGDYIQSFSPEADKGMTNIGGTPIDDSGNVQNTVGSGILANGNIFISARYVNINSKIQSGLADWNVTIPKDYVLYYRDGEGKAVEVTEAKAKEMTGTTIYVGVKSGKDIVSAVSNESGNDAKTNYLTYDAANDRFALSGIEVNGGRVSIVGTILNTSKDGKGQIQALDGYGAIQVENLSGKDLELVNLSTGSGVEGQIQITDLDWKNGGRKARTTTYTRENGKVKAEVETFSYDKNGNLTDSTKSGAAADKYDTTAGQWYSYQTGTDSSVTKTYEYHGTRADWWGIENEQPTLQELLNIGGKQTGYEPGTPTVLNGGAYVSGSNVVENAETGKTQTGDNGYWTKSEVTFDKAGSTPVEKWDIRSKRLWYILGLAKKWDVKLEQTTEHTTIKQTSVKADYDIGIGFIGSDAGGTLSVKGNNQNVYVGGNVSNAAGTTTISGNNIVQNGGLITTGSLVLNASGNAGTAGSAIETNASHVSGKAGGDFAVSVADHGITLGGITAGGTAAITTAGGITQDKDALLTGKRVELTAENGAITGANSAALQVSVTGQEYAKDTGLKASAYGNISIENTSGDLYLDSVTSEAGDVTLTTNGSFVDNNFTDTEDEDAKAKLLGWANKAVLENSENTITKQKDMLVYKVEEKYSRYNALKANVKDGKYTLSDAERDTLTKSGVDADAYIAERQAEYDGLKAAGVDTWTAETVKAYTDNIRASKDTIYGNASLTKDALAGDTFLTKDEKASILVGSAKSAKDLLVTFAPGGIKEGITDTNTTIKQVPHVSGRNVSLIAKGNAKQEDGSGSIGKKTEGMPIDLSAGNLEHLTSAELLALASAERGDFQVNGDTVIVSSVSSIAADAAGKITARAEKGGLYLVTENGYNAGSELFADDELRLKASGDITGITVGSNDQIVLESGEGKISDVTISEGTGVLTARAQDGVSLTKDSGDLVIHTVYASEGDVSLTVADGASIYGEGGHDADDESGEKVQGTTFINIQGENVTISAKDGKVANLGTNGTEDGEGNYNSLGIKVTGTPASETEEAVPGKFIADASGYGDVTFFGDIADGTNVSANTLNVTSRGTIAGGTFTAAGALSVHNAAEHTASQAPKGTITGGTFIGQSASITNESVQTANEAGLTTGGITGGAFTANGTGENDSLTIHNAGTIAGGSFNGKALTDVSNTGTIDGGTYSGASVSVTNAGTLSAADITAASGSLTFTDTEEAKTGGEEGKEVNLTADKGDVTITAQGTFDVTTVTSAGRTALESGKSASIGTLAAGSAVLTTTGEDSSLTVNTSHVANGYTVDAKGDVKLDKVISGETSITAGGNVTNDSLTAGGDVTITAGGTLTANTVTVEGHSVQTESAGGTTIGSLTAGSASLTTTGEDSDLKVNLSKVAGELAAKAAGAADLHTVTAGKTTITAGGNVTNDTIDASGDVTINAGGTVDTNTVTAEGHHVQTESAGSSTIGTLTAGSSSLTTTGANSGLTVNTSRIAGDLAAKAAGSAVLTNVEAGKTTIEAGGDISNDSLTATGDVTITSTGGSVGSNQLNAGANNITINSEIDTNVSELTGGETSITAGGSVSNETLTANGDVTITAETGSITSGTLSGGDNNVTLKSGASTNVTTLTGGTTSIIAGGNVTNDMLNASGAVEITSTGGSVGSNTLDAGANSVTISSGTNTNVSELTGGETSITASGDISNDSLTAAGDVTINAGGTLTANAVTAEGHSVQTESAGGTTIGGLTAGSASLTTTGEGSGLNVTTTNVTGDLTANIAGAADLHTVTAGKTTITAGGNVTNTTLNAGETSITAGGSVESGTLTTTGDLTVKADEAIKANTIKSEDQKVILGAGTNVTVNTLTGGTAEVTAVKGDISLIHSTVTDLLKLGAGANVTLTESVSKILGVNAGKNITGKADEEGKVTITSGDITMNAGENIHLTTEDHVNKLSGVDLTGKPLPVTGSGSAGSLITGSAEGHTFGGASGSASLTSNTGKVTLTAGDTVEADNIHLDTAGGTGTPQTGGTAELHLNGNVIGVDNVSGTGETEKIHITVNGGADQKPAYHAGIHSGNPDVETIVTGSQIQHLDLTGKDKVGVTNTQLSGDSVIATDTVRTEIEKNGNTAAAEHIGSLFLSGTNIETGELFTDIKNGITINGVRFPYTASSVMARALYGDQYLGRDGRKKEEKELAAKGGEILFAEVSQDEQYHAVTL